MRDQFPAPRFSLVRTSQYIPHHALLWACNDTALQRQLPFKTRLRLVSLAIAAAGAGGRSAEPDLAALAAPLDHFCHTAPQHHDQDLLDPAAVSAAASNVPALTWLHARGWPVQGPAVLCAAARHGDLPSLQAACRLWREQCPLGPAVLAAAAASATPDALPKLDWLLDQGCPADEAAAVAAARAGRRRALRWLADKARVRLSCRTLEAAAAAGSVELAEWVLERALKCDRGACRCGRTGAATAGGEALAAAAAGGHLRVAAWVDAQMRGCAFEPAGEWAGDADEQLALAVDAGAAGEDGGEGEAEAGDEEAAAKRRRLRAAYDAALEAAARAGQVRGMRWLAGRGARCTAAALKAAAGSGVVEAARLAWRLPRSDHGTRGDAAAAAALAGAMEAAAAAADVDMMSYLVGEAGATLNGRDGHGNSTCDCGAALLRLAVSSRRPAAAALHAARWLLAAGCLLQPTRRGALLESAAATGEVERLVWALGEAGEEAARAHGALVGVAAKAGSTAVLELLAGARAPLRYGASGYVCAGRNGDMATLACLLRLGVPWGADTVVRSIPVAPLRVVQWMDASGFFFDRPQAYASAQAAGRRQLAEWMRGQGFADMETKLEKRSLASFSGGARGPSQPPAQRERAAGSGDDPWDDIRHALRKAQLRLRDRCFETVVVMFHVFGACGRLR